MGAGTAFVKKYEKNMGRMLFNIYKKMLSIKIYFMACTLKFTTPEVRCRKFYAKPNTPQQATGRGSVCSFRPKGLGICTSRHSPNIPLPVAGIKSFFAGFSAFGGSLCDRFHTRRSAIKKPPSFRRNWVAFPARTL